MSLRETFDYWAMRAKGRPAQRLSFGLLSLALLGVVSLLAWRSTAFWDALSPVTHKKQIYQLSGVYKIDPMLLAAIVKTESGFFPYSSSRKGALGLMQMLPETAEQVAAELKIDYQDPDDLYREEINLRLGTHYFSGLLKAFDGNLVLALAAYNAGMGKVRSWHLQPYGTDQDQLIDAIPVAETRAYVRQVLKNYRFFKTLQAVKRTLQGDSDL
jgi:soluble lytic murein transglycosylase